MLKTRSGAIGIGILAFALVLRAGWVLWVQDANPYRSLSTDSYVYESGALAILAEGSFQVAPEIDHPQFVRTPGYPLFIATAYWIFGASRTSLLLLQVVVSVATILIVMRLGQRVWNQTTGLVAGALVALDPLLLHSAGHMLTETLHGFFVALAGLVGFELFRRGGGPTGYRALGLGSAIAAATLVRPTTYYLPVLILALLAYRAWRSRCFRPWARATLAFLLPIVVVCGAWQLRNCQRVGSCAFTGIEGANLYLFRAASVVADREGEPLDNVQADFVTEIGANSVYEVVNGLPIEGASSRTGPIYDEMRRKGVAILLSAPWTSLEVSARGLVREMGGPGRESVFPYLGIDRPSTGLLILAVIPLGVFYVLTLLGIARAVRDEASARLAHLFVLGVIGYIVILSAGPEAESRFRVPVVPLLAVYAAGGIELLVRRLASGVGGRRRSGAADGGGVRSWFHDTRVDFGRRKRERVGTMKRCSTGTELFP